MGLTTRPISRLDIERTFAWLGHFRRLVVRYERLITTCTGFFHLACALLTLRRGLK
jgi:transposase